MGSDFSVLLVHHDAGVRRRVMAALDSPDLGVVCEAFGDHEAAWQHLLHHGADVALLELGETGTAHRGFLTTLARNDRLMPVIGLADSIPSSPDCVMHYQYGVRDIVCVNDLTRLPLAVLREAECGTAQEDLKHALDDLAEYKSVFRTVVEHMPVMVDARDEHGAIVFWNQECERVTGYRADEVVGNPRFRELVYPDPEYREKLTRDWEQHGDNFRDWECELTCKDGSRRVIAWSSVSDLVPVPGWRAWGIGVDVTERKRVEEALVSASRLEATATLAGGIAHDFNNLLSVILGNAGLAREELGEGHGVAGWLRDIEEAARRAGDLARQLLAFARRGQYQALIVDPNTTVTDVLRRNHGGVLRGRAIRTQLEPNAPRVKGDPTLLAMLLTNILANAIEATEGNRGEISVTTEAAQGGADGVPGVRLIICDAGCGMSPETRKRAFEPFFSTKFQGRGLGLAAAHGIVLGHGGTIEVDSSPSTGTEVTVWLPAHGERSEGAEEDGYGRPRRRSILVVDDDPLVRRFVGDLMERLDYRVFTAGRTSAALSVPAVQDGRFDLAIVDVLLPGEDSASLVHALLGNAPNAKLVLLSGGGVVTESMRAFVDAGARYVSKPVRAQELSRIVHEMLGDALAKR